MVKLVKVKRREDMEIEISNKIENYQYISRGIHRYNNENGKTPYFENRSDEPKEKEVFGCYAFENGEIIGGMVVYEALQWLQIQKTFISNTYRGKNIGTAIFKKLEEYAKQRKLVGIRVETLDFQARGFYEKMGCTLLYELKDCPKGNIEYGFVKYIES